MTNDNTPDYARLIAAGADLVRAGQDFKKAVDKVGKDLRKAFEGLDLDLPRWEDEGGTPEPERGPFTHSDADGHVCCNECGMRIYGQDAYFHNPRTCYAPWEDA